MKLLKIIPLFFLILLVIASFSRCSSIKTTKEQRFIKLEEKVPFEIGVIHFQKWAAGVQEGGLGIHMYITVIKNRELVEFDSVYFRGLKTNIGIGKMGYFASLKKEVNIKKDIIMSRDSIKEYGNIAQNNKSKFPFELNQDECVISYIEKEVTKYYKVRNLIEKPSENFPNTSPNN